VRTDSKTGSRFAMSGPDIYRPFLRDLKIDSRWLTQKFHPSIMAMSAGERKV
jgi:hypothetical protein